MNQPPRQPENSGESKPTDAPNLYAVLRLEPGASKLDIINAYRRAKLTFRKDSLAVYSLYSEDDLDAIRRQIETAYEVLTDSDRRASYDQAHGFATTGGMADETPAGEEEIPADAGSEPMPTIAGSDNVVQLRGQSAEPSYDPDLERRIRSADEFPGAFLREVREYRGIGLRDVAEHTRISLSYLKAIEAEDAAGLPAVAYLKGYLGQYAAEIGLEPHLVVQGYPPLADKG